MNSLTGIKELITNFPQILQGPSLGLIITRVLELLMDVEHKIRITVVHLLSDIFRELPSHYLIPFYDILNTHVACAMTHRELPIQQDSLKFINVMIEFAPDAVKRKFPTLIKNFIRIISGYKYDHHSKGVFSKNSKRDLEKSKIEMFSKFYQLLEAMYSVPEDIQKSEKNDIEVLSNKCRFELRNHNNLYKRIPDLSSLFKNSQSCQFVSEGQHLNEFQVQISDIMPVLFDIWAEFATTGESDKFTSECQLTEGVAELLEIILEIILLLYEKILAMKSQHLVRLFDSNLSSDDLELQIFKNFCLLFNLFSLFAFYFLVFFINLF